MTDPFLIRIAEEMAKGLEDAHPYHHCPRLVPSYNAILTAAKANHPNDPFLSTITPIKGDDDDEVSVAEMRVLLALIRIALESLKGSPEASVLR